MESTSPRPHQPRLMQELGALLQRQRVAALGTTSEDGGPFVSMVPFAIEPTQGVLVLHVSGLAAHTGYMLARPRVSLLVMQAEVAGEPVHALSRLTLEGWAQPLEVNSAPWQACRTAYLQRFPEAEPMTQLGDFRFMAIQVQGARQIAGFGAARSVGADEIQQVLSLCQ